MNPRTYRQRPDVLAAMPVIRMLFTMRGFGVEMYGDDAIVDVLLGTCPGPDSTWLSKEHFALAVRQLVGEQQK